MRLTQFVCFEITDKCTRGREHTACPNQHPDRWLGTVGRRTMTILQMVEIVTKMHAGGWGGMVGFHHYCEPLADMPRLLAVVRYIRSAVPGQRFVLWTNGDMFPEDLSILAGIFSQIMVSNYAGRDLSRLGTICPIIHSVPTTLDWRMNPPLQYGRSPNCLRPHLEMTFDYYGQVRTCCNDWRAITSVGNIHDTPFEVLWERWVALRDSVAANPMGDRAPPRCLCCGTRYTNMSQYVPEVADRIQHHLAGK